MKTLFDAMGLIVGEPTGHYRIHTMGERCSWCGYVEKSGA
jgi:hypothetical protein